MAGYFNPPTPIFGYATQRFPVNRDLRKERTIDSKPVKFFHDQVCRLCPEFGPVVRHRDSKFSCALRTMPLIT